MAADENKENVKQEDKEKEAVIAEILGNLDARKHPRRYAAKYAVKKGLQRAADKLEKTAEKLGDSGEEKCDNFDKAAYYNDPVFKKMTPEQQRIDMYNNIRGKHPLKRKLSDLLKNASKVFASGAEKIAIPEVVINREMAKKLARSKGKG